MLPWRYDLPFKDNFSDGSSCFAALEIRPCLYNYKNVESMVLNGLCFEIKPFFQLQIKRFVKVEENRFFYHFVSRKLYLENCCTLIVLVP